MIPTDTENNIVLKKGLRLKLLTTHALIFALPLLVISCFFYSSNIFQDLTQTVIVSFTLILILAGLIIFRKLSDKFMDFTLENTSLKSDLQKSLLKFESCSAELAQANSLLKKETTERESLENILQENEERYRSILQNIEYGYYEVDLDGNFVFFNDLMCRIFNSSKKDLAGRNLKQYLDKEKGNKIAKAFQYMLSTGLPSDTFTFEVKNGTTSTSHMELSIFLMKDRSDQATGFRGLIRDVTEQKIAAEERKQLETQFYVAQKMESIGTLAGGMAHNFNNLLMGIQGNTSLLRYTLEDTAPVSTRLDNIDKLVESGSKLTNQLLGYARKGQYELKSFSVNHLLEYVSDTFATTRKDIRVNHDFEDKLFSINADQSQIEQVLLNLMVNAADAMPEGGELHLKTMNRSHKDMSGKKYNAKYGNYVMISVKDSGSGMDKQTIKRIFEPFFTTKDLSNGTGLGLASSYGIIKGHGGYIDVESEKGHGSTFKIFLPATYKTYVENEKSEDRKIDGSGTILIVDDEEIVLEATAMLLREVGYSVIEAKTGHEAVEQLREKSSEIDAVILDMVMPNMGGGETFNKIRGIEPGIKVLLSSGYGIDGNAREILNRGCDGFIQKPYNLKDLSNKLGEIFN